MFISAKKLNSKITYILCSACLAMIIISIRLVYLQIIKTHNFFTQGQKNFLRLETIPSPRGNIVDSTGKLLVTNRPVTTVYWQGSGNPVLNDQQQQIVNKIQTIIGNDIATDNTKMNAIKFAERYYKKTLLAADLSFDQLSQIAEQFPHHNNIIIDTHFKRFYPYKSLASHLLGYLANIDVEMSGQMGLEKVFEETLKGDNGSVLKIINSWGKNIEEIERKKISAGNNLQITLDSNLQAIIENVFPKDQCGTFIIMDPNDGALSAVTSQPTFDPSIFLDPISPENWQALQQKKPFLNRAFNASYPPGSIFKLITISAALENNIIEPDSTWACKGFVSFAKRKYWCHRRYGHGELTTEQALSLSCNILFYEIGKRINIDLLAEYAQKFGLGQKTTIIFPERTGLVPTTEWKQQTKGEPWWPGETLSAAIGQSFLLVTPIQVARMIASIFTGYLVKPRILINEPISKQPLDIKQETIEFLKKSMKAVVTKGTGRNISKVKDIEIYAKTSTAQTSTFSKRLLGKEYLEHGWFVGYLSYKDYKPLTIVILIEHVGSSRIATLAAKNFLIEYKKLMDSNYPTI